MGKLIRRTITITIVETWTFVWTPDDGPAGHSVTLVSHPSATEEEANENLQATLIPTELDKPNVSQPPTPRPAPDVELDLLPGSAPDHATASRKRPARRSTSKKRHNQSDSDQ